MSTTSRERIYIKFSPEVRTLLSDANIDFEQAVKAELKELAVEATTGWERDPTSRELDRELVLVILASGLAVTLVGTGVARVIDAVGRAGHAKAKTRHLTAALDGGGNPIRDSNGNPIFNVIEEPTSLSQGEVSTAKARAGTLLEFELTSGGATKPN